MRLLAIDPGSIRSGWVIFDTGADRVREHGKTDNAELLTMTGATSTPGWYDQLVVEFMEASYGSNIGKEVTETIWWSGRFCEAAARSHRPFDRIGRNHVRKHFTGRMNGKAVDAGVRGALIDRYGGIGGKAVAVGLKASPGPLYGIVVDQWAALALAIAWHERPQP
jgi:hypothetical protein